MKLTLYVASFLKAWRSTVDNLVISDFQARVLAIPDDVDVFLGGGRGGGKSYSLALLALRHAEEYGDRARVLYVRQTYRGLADFEAMTRELFGAVYGQAARYNASEHVWRLPGGGYLELGQLADATDYLKYQGRSFTLLLVDEAGHYADPAMLDRLRSNLRAPAGIPVRTVMAANPGDPGHAWLAKRYVFKAAPWAPFTEEATGRLCIHAPSTLADNQTIDRGAYRRQIEAACATDAELLKAWVYGDWAIARGAFFATVLGEKRNALAPWPEVPRAWLDHGAELFLSHDFGVSAPSVTFVCLRSPGATGPDGRFYPRGSVLLLDELASNVPGQLNEGLRWTVPTLAEAIRELATRWRMKRPEGAADDAIFAATGSGAGSIASEFSRCAIYFTPAGKGSRIAGWERMRRMLADAGQPDRPGLYITRAAEYFWATVPYLARDPRRVEDVDSRGPDHAADACRYAVVWERPSITPFALYDRSFDTQL